MRLVWNWWAVLRKAWSIRLNILAALLGSLEFALPFVAPVEPDGLFAIAAALVSIGAAVARLFAQPKSLP